MSYLYKIGPKYFKIIDFYILPIISIIKFSLNYLFLLYVQKDEEMLYQKHYNRHFIVQSKID